ncbi:hypothetical protein CFOL_v3_17310 [Cephalotus follicularis]|uniref:Uncharacterized protein n=1 Tax=Cephalotus follicularis TaxID=3775 RepID=A0A1Q3C0Q8_CEPFO|nr:hypothetical protein CFOL_v3_17310 [Cephalotus follicularis]
MTLLEVITSALANLEPVACQSEHPIILNPDDIFLNLKPDLKKPDPTSLAIPVNGWKISQRDSELLDLCKNFWTKLERKLKDTHNFGKDEFIGIFNSFLEKIREKVGISIGIDSSNNEYIRLLIEKVGFLMSRDVTGLVLEASVDLEIWELVETLIANRLVDQLFYSKLVVILVAKNKADLVCLCIKHASNLGLTELICILKYFLCPPRDAYDSMTNVRKQWESQALLAMEKMVPREKDSNKDHSRRMLHVAKAASILLMIAHDGFSASELCLHYLIASPNFDELILSSSISKLSGNEMLSLIRYLGKWLKKYQRFPQAGPCPKASSMLGLEACDCAPKLEDVVRFLGLVLDENFSSLLLHAEFHEELISIEKVVHSLVSEAGLCCSMADLVEYLRVEV